MRAPTSSSVSLSTAKAFPGEFEHILFTSGMLDDCDAADLAESDHDAREEVPGASLPGPPRPAGGSRRPGPEAPVPVP